MTWFLWRCDDWRRWATMKGTVFSDEWLNGKVCSFSGCTRNHNGHIVGETMDINYAEKWFRGWP